MKEHYAAYYSKEHVTPSRTNEIRHKMYLLEYKLLKGFMPKTGYLHVLDVGCGGGYFLDYFKKDGHYCYGTELGNEAALEAGRKHIIYEGELPHMALDRIFDVIISRGFIEHVHKPKEYLSAMDSLLAPGGIMYFCSTPNAKSLCCRLFKERWNQHEPEWHLMHFNARHFDEYFSGRGYSKLSEKHFYEETPYADIDADSLSVMDAVRLRDSGMPIEHTSPPFYGTMMALAYRKNK
jgi:2-polyprenyl-3-methyl-5-hydroxy-6-metoxy-1,4-benzoquinol methylase